ncbi:MAG TPA: endonuclease/exonuclease/phosphatase family protein, partial [Candidatus Hydrogenedentes bacterium]|nr:endonuclease/exonuclease/phosphatase family protein [Candidatus Hydrogenedentota bacterium]
MTLGIRLARVCGAALAACFATFAGVAQDTPAPGKLSVITYNVQFLPGIAAGQNKRPEPEYRVTRIVEETRKFDIVALQETFEVKHRTALKDGMKTAWNGQLNSVESPDEKGHVTNGGCLLMTRLPILATDAVVYKNFSKPKDFGFRADGFAAKGAIWARIARSAGAQDDFIDVFVTHLEARADELRPLQYAELAEFIKAKSAPGKPMLLLGDLNTAGMTAERANPESQYSVMMKAFGDARGEGGITDVWVTLKGDVLGGTTNQDSIETGKRIDYI